MWIMKLFAEANLVWAYRLFLLLLIPAAINGCVSKDSYRFGRLRSSAVPYRTTPVSMSLGEADHRSLDNIEGAIFLPFDSISEVIPWNRPIGSLQSRRREAVNQAVKFLSQNDLADVHVSVRDYQPIDQWQRLIKNNEVHPFWKYTDGSFRVLSSTLLPERVLRIDRYNPHTKTLHINSGNPASAVHAAATAKDFLGNKNPGVYAISQHVPLLPVWQQLKITKDSLQYARTNEDWSLEKGIYPKAYAKIGSSLLSDAYAFVPGSGGLPFFAAPAVSMAGRVFGRTAGEIQVQRLSQHRNLSAPTGSVRR